MATVPVGTAKTFRKFIRSVIQVCNIAMEKKNSLETLDLLSIKGGSRAMLLGGCEALAEGAAAGVWGRKNRSPRVLECT